MFGEKVNIIYIRCESMGIGKNTTVNEVLKISRQSLKVFNKYGIDACCGGAETLEATAKKKKVDVEKLMKELNEITMR